MTKLSRSQGFRLRGTNCEELLLMRVLVQAHVDLVQALVALVQAYVNLVQALVDLVQALVALVQAHLPQGGFIWVVRRQVVVPGSGLVGAVWSVFVRWVRWKQVCHLQVVHGLGVGLDESVVSGTKG